MADLEFDIGFNISTDVLKRQISVVDNYLSSLRKKAADIRLASAGMPATTASAKGRKNDSVATILAESQPLRSRIFSATRGEHKAELEKTIDLIQRYVSITGRTPIQAAGAVFGAMPKSGTYARDFRERALGEVAQRKLEERQAVNQEQENRRAELADTQRDIQLAEATLKALNKLLAVENEENNLNRWVELLEKDKSGEKKLSDVEVRQLYRLANNFETEKFFAGDYDNPLKEKIVGLVDERKMNMKDLADSAALASKRLARLSLVATGAAMATRAMWGEYTREKGIFATEQSISKYRYRDTQFMQRMGISEQAAINFSKNTGSFIDRLRLGEVSDEEMTSFAIFGRETYKQLRTDPYNKPALLDAIQRDVAGAEARGFTRQTALSKIGAEDIALALGFTPEERAELWFGSAGADAQQARAREAFMAAQGLVGAKANVENLMSANKTGALVGGGTGAVLGSLGAAAGGAALGKWAFGKGGALLGAKVGAALGPWGALIGAGAGGLAGLVGGTMLGGYLGAQTEAGLSSMFAPSEPTTSPSITTQNTVEVSITGDAMREMLNGGSYVSTFETSAALDAA